MERAKPWMRKPEEVRSTTASGLESGNSFPVSKCLPMVNCAYVHLTLSPASFISPNFKPSSTSVSLHTSPCSSTSANPLSPSSLTTAIMHAGLVLQGRKATLRPRSAVSIVDSNTGSPTHARKGRYMSVSPELSATLASAALKDYERLFTPSKTTYRPSPKRQVPRLCRVPLHQSFQPDASGGRLSALMREHVKLSRKIRARQQRHSCDFDLYSILKRLRS